MQPAGAPVATVPPWRASRCRRGWISLQPAGADETDGWTEKGGGGETEEQKEGVGASSARRFGAHSLVVELLSGILPSRGREGEKAIGTMCAEPLDDRWRVARRQPGFA
jgi:hypothetical protein